MIDIAVVGSLNLDTTVQVPRLPQPGETVLGKGHFQDTGGKGANQAVAAARLGRRVAMVGMVGADEAGARLLDSLRADGVDVAPVTVEGSSGIAVITVDDSGENMIVVDPGANGSFSPDRLEAHGRVVADAPVVLVQLEIPLETVAAVAERAGGILIVNPAPAAELDRATLDRIAVLVPNATELALLVGGAPPDSADEALDMAATLEGPGAVVVTLGAEGAVVWDGAVGRHFPAPKVQAIDPTAAGDAFCGGLADAVSRGIGLDDAVGWAVRCGAVAATRWGAQASLPTRQEVMALEEEE